MNSDLFLINPKIALALANRELSASLDKIFGSWNMRCMKFYQEYENYTSIKTYDDVFAVRIKEKYN